MNQFFYNVATTTWALKHVLFLTDFDYNWLVLTMLSEVITLTRHNQLSNSWTKTLNLVPKILSEKFASSN